MDLAGRFGELSFADPPPLQMSSLFKELESLELLDYIYHLYNLNKISEMGNKNDNYPICFTSRILGDCAGSLRR